MPGATPATARSRPGRGPWASLDGGAAVGRRAAAAGARWLGRAAGAGGAAANVAAPSRVDGCRGRPGRDPRGAGPGACRSIPVPRGSRGARRGGGALASFLETRGQTYRRAMSSPLEGEGPARGCRRTWPGARSAGARRRRRPPPARRRRRARGRAGAGRCRASRRGWPGATTSCRSWRTSRRSRRAACIRPMRACVPPARRRAARAWETGRDGLPFVDACMRYLTAMAAG
jgi:deoxyribodipyrimidine photo-lyase